MTKHYAIFLDIDGTLADDNKIISDENKKAIRLAQEQGHYVFINTGRASSRLPDSLSTVCEPDGIITSLGSTISLHGKVIYTAYTTPEETVDIFNIAYPTGWHYFFDTEYIKYEVNVPTDRVDVAISSSPDQKARLLAFSDNSDEFIIHDTDFILKNDIRLAKLVAFPEQDNLEQFFKLKKYFNIYHTANYYDLSLKNCGKDRAIAIAAKAVGVDITDTIAVGDSENDISMLDFAGTSAVVSNANSEVKQHADYICDKDNNHSGVAEIIKHFVL